MGFGGHTGLAPKSRHPTHPSGTSSIKRAVRVAISQIGCHTPFYKFCGADLTKSFEVFLRARRRSAAKRCSPKFCRGVKTPAGYGPVTGTKNAAGSDTRSVPHCGSRDLSGTRRLRPARCVTRMVRWSDSNDPRKTSVPKAHKNLPMSLQISEI